jgi:hypothetical protein
VLGDAVEGRGEAGEGGGRRGEEKKWGRRCEWAIVWGTDADRRHHPTNDGGGGRRAPPAWCYGEKKVVAPE